MLNPVKLPYGVRTTVATLFHHFGIHCATHQKRVILISCVVITSLFYPALALYSTSNPLSHLSSSLFNPYHFDLSELWEGHDALRIREDAAAWTRCGMERTLRIERVLIPSSEWTPSGAATPSTLQFALQLDNKIRNAIGHSCVRTPDGQCLVLSPRILFDNIAPHTPADILNTINASQNTTVSGIPISPAAVVSRRPSVDTHALDSDIEHVVFFVLTYYFVESDCLTSEGHDGWLNNLVKIASDDQRPISATPFVFHKPKFIALQYDSTSSRPPHLTAISLFLYLSYLIIFVYFSGSLRRMDTVHSRFGLTFTGLIELVASTITSVSVCALAGFRVTMVPWGILPVIIVFVGAENMFILIDAVTSTPVTLSVKQRIGTGLAVAGTSNTFKTVVYNTILGTIAFFATGAIRQFCSFAIVLLVAHWFLIHTFFIAVLSIDLQRLELSDMLSQDKASKPSVPLSRKASGEPLLSKRRQTMSTIQQLLRGRAAKNGSLVMMLAVTATLYYVTYPFPNRPKDDVDPFSFLKHATAIRRPTALAEDYLSPAWNIWNILNPDHDHLVHIRLETPVVVSLNIDNDDRRTGSRHTYESMARRPMRPFWLLKIVILPIGSTTGCLYLLLLYLLKNTDRLEAKNRLGMDLNGCRIAPVEGNVKFMMLPRAFATDVELISASHDGSVIAIVSAEGELVLWKEGYHKIDTSDALCSAASGSGPQLCITSLALHHNGEYCAIGTDSGAMAAWKLSAGKPLFNCSPFTVALSSSVKDLEFVMISSGDGNAPPTGTCSDTCSRQEDFFIVVTCEDGSAIYVKGWKGVARLISPSRAGSILQSQILHRSNHDRIGVAFVHHDGTVELISHCGDEWLSSCILQAGNPTDPVVELCVEDIAVDGSFLPVLAAATRSGVVSLWDPIQRECIFLMDDALGEITRLRICPMPSRPCQQCHELTPDSFVLAFSVGHTVCVHHASLSSVSKRCTCPVSRALFARDSFGRRSRSGSLSVSSSPLRSRPKLPTIVAAEPPAFPVSAHGVHSRRAGSEKDTNRRASETLSTINSQQEEFELLSSVQSHFAKGLPTAAVDSVWRNLGVDHIININCERGGWDLVNSERIVGLRRRSRLPQNGLPEPNHSSLPLATSSLRGELTPSVLDRWELWTFNPTKPEMGARVSSLLALTPKTGTYPITIGGSSSSGYPRLAFTRVSPVFVGQSACVAGFGNTTGVLDFSQHTSLS